MVKDIKELQILPVLQILPSLTEGLTGTIYSIGAQLQKYYSQEDLASLFKILYRELSSLIEKEEVDKEIELTCDKLRDDLDIFAFACTSETLQKATKEVIRESGE
jgi:hypothetical protein